jgi:autotransporter-associated beta strand protein
MTTATGAMTVNAGTLILTGVNTYAGVTTIDSDGTFDVGGPNFGTDASVTSNITNNGIFNYNETNGTAVTYAGVVSGNGSININGEVGLFVAENTEPGTLSGAQPTQNFLDGSAGTVSVSGSIVTLSGNNTDTGTTTVNNAALLVQGVTAKLAGPVVVSSGSYLGGNGTINGDVTMDGGFAPGLGEAETITVNSNIGWTTGHVAAFETLTINGNLAWDPQNTNYFHLNSANSTAISDKVTVTGNVSYFGSTTAGSIIFDFEDTGFFSGTPEIYTLLTSNTNLANLGLTPGSFLAENVYASGTGEAYGQSFFLFANGGKTLEFELVPEPAAWGLLAGGAMLLLGLRRKRLLAKAAKGSVETKA